jgi:hypothetical protein
MRNEIFTPHAWARWRWWCNSMLKENWNWKIRETNTEVNMCVVRRNTPSFHFCCCCCYSHIFSNITPDFVFILNCIKDFHNHRMILKERKDFFPLNSPFIHLYVMFCLFSYRTHNKKYTKRFVFSINNRTHKKSENYVWDEWKSENNVRVTGSIMHFVINLCVCDGEHKWLLCNEDLNLHIFEYKYSFYRSHPNFSSD